jgi:hypothetical protein
MNNQYLSEHLALTNPLVSLTSPLKALERLRTASGPWPRNMFGGTTMGDKIGPGRLRWLFLLFKPYGFIGAWELHKLELIGACSRDPYTGAPMRP